MSESPFNFGDDFDFEKAWETIRQQAWLRTGAVTFGGAVADFRRTLVENGIDPDTADVLTAKTIEELIQGIAGTVPGIVDACVRGYEMIKAAERAAANQKEA